MARARGGRSGRLAPEPDLRTRAATDAREAKGRRGKMITGIILFLAGLVALIMLWDIASSVFEKEGPLAFDLKDFEGMAAVDIRKYLEGKQGGYSRYVTVQNAEAATFNSAILDTGGRKVKDYAYLVTAPNSQLHARYIEKNELLAGVDDSKTTLEKIFVDPPTTSNFRIVMITTNGKPREDRINQTMFWAGPDRFQKNATGFTGVIRPLSSVPDEDIRVIVQAKGFSGIKLDQKDYMYVLYLEPDTRGLPPETGTAFICLVVPVLFMLGGLTLTFLSMKDPVRGHRGGAPAGAGRGSRGRRAGGDDEDEDDEEGDEPPPASRRPSARGSARKSGTARKSSSGSGSARKSSRRGR